MSPENTPPADSTSLQIGGLGLALEFNDHRLQALFERRYADFIPAGVIHLRASVEIETITGRINLQDMPLDFQEGSLVCNLPDCRLRIDAGQRRAELYLRCAQPLVQLEYFLRLVYALLAYEQDGLLLHASGIVRRGLALAFFGYSGSGKSTIARFSDQNAVLNDDLLLLLPQGGKWVAHATPFWNPGIQHKVVGSAPLAGLLRLVQDSQVYLERLHEPLAVAELFACLPVVSADPDRSAGLLQRCQAILGAVPAYRLHFLPDDTFWKVIDAEF